MKITYQGVAGAYSHIAASQIFPDQEYVGYDSFEEAILPLQEGKADYAVIPVENSNAGRVTDVHFILPRMTVRIVGEYFLRIEHQLLANNGASLAGITKAVSHPQALAQCSEFLKKHNIIPVPGVDTAMSCETVINSGGTDTAAIASVLAGKLYGMHTVASNIENDSRNTTRFLVMKAKEEIPVYEKDGAFITSLVFHTRHIPAALYKALGGFATNGINITKLESYLVDGMFSAAQFYAEIEAHPEQEAYKNAMEELDFFSDEVIYLGTYKSVLRR